MYSMQSPSKFQHSSQRLKNQPQSSFGGTKLIGKVIPSKKSNTGGNTILTSNYTAEPLKSKQHGTGSKTDVKTSGTE
jgi:hypothetical protein